MHTRLRPRTPYTPPTLTPIEQIRAGRMALRIPQLLFGLILYGWSMAMQIEAVLGLDPWDVLHQGIARHVPLTFGQVVIVVGALLLVLWIPLRQMPGLGTVLNVIVIGLAADAGLAIMSQPDSLAARFALLIGGVVLNGLAGALYIGTHLGPGPRDGLWLGVVRKTGLSVRLIRTVVEVTVVVVGFLLGGTVGIGTVVYALGIGPIVQFFLPLVSVNLEERAES